MLVTTNSKSTDTSPTALEVCQNGLTNIAKKNKLNNIAKYHNCKFPKNNVRQDIYKGNSTIWITPHKKYGTISDSPFFKIKTAGFEYLDELRE